MAQIWVDLSYAMSNTTRSNTNEYLRFQWYFVTFSGETQLSAQVRWRKTGTYPSIMARMNPNSSLTEAAAWSTPITIDRMEDTTTWTLSGGQYVPPADASRRYSNVTTIDFPAGFFSLGTWAFQVRTKALSSTGVADADWGGWSQHNIEIVDYTQSQLNAGAFDIGGGQNGVTMGAGLPNEGVYAFNAEVMSEAGVTTQSADSNTFFVYETNKYLNSGSNVQAVPEHSHDGTQAFRVKRTT